MAASCQVFLNIRKQVSYLACGEQGEKKETSTPVRDAFPPAPPAQRRHLKTLVHVLSAKLACKICEIKKSDSNESDSEYPGGA